MSLEKSNSSASCMCFVKFKNPISEGSLSGKSTKNTLLPWFKNFSAISNALSLLSGTLSLW